jgi:hypothetical protein
MQVNVKKEFELLKGYAEALFALVADHQNRFGIATDETAREAQKIAGPYVNILVDSGVYNRADAMQRLSDMYVYVVGDNPTPEQREREERKARRQHEAELRREIRLEARYS